jgi:hypothetical protein
MFELSDGGACCLYPPRRMRGLRVPSTLVSGYEGKGVRVPDRRRRPQHGFGDLGSPFGIPDSSGLFLLGLTAETASHADSHHG